MVASIPFDQDHEASADSALAREHICAFGLERDHLLRALKRIRTATDALLPGYRILEPHHSLPASEADGILWGLHLLVEQIEEYLDGLQEAVVDDSMPAEEATNLAQERVLEAVLQLRFGSRVRRRRLYQRAALPAVAELGRICVIVRRLADDLAQLSDECDGVRHSRPATVRIKARPAM